MPGQVIGKFMNNGFPGYFAESGDHLVKAFQSTGDAALYFGDPVFSTDSVLGAVGSTGLTATAANFKGVATSQVKTANTYMTQLNGQYLLNEMVPVIERGSVAVSVSNAAVNAPVVDGPVYVRVAGGTSLMPVGGFEAAPDGTTPANTIQIANATWGQGADANGVAMLTIKTRNNS